MLLSAVSVLVVAQSSSEIPEGLMNNPVHLYPYHIQHIQHLEPANMCSRLEAPPHFSQLVRQYLIHKFPDRWIGLCCAQNWPPRSPDLNPLDYHLWS